MLQVPIVKALSAVVALMVLSVSQLLTLFVAPGSSFSIVGWNGQEKYYGVIDGQEIVIYLEEAERPIKKQINKNIQKDFQKDKDGESDTSTENETVIEYETPQPNPMGKVKIYFKDDKNKGTQLIYEREIGGEISDTDQEYIERILTNIEKFHKDNRTYNQIRDKLDGFWKGLGRSGKGN